MVIEFTMPFPWPRQHALDQQLLKGTSVVFEVMLARKDHAVNSRDHREDFVAQVCGRAIILNDLPG